MSETTPTQTDEQPQPLALKKGGRVLKRYGLTDADAAAAMNYLRECVLEGGRNAMRAVELQLQIEALELRAEENDIRKEANEKPMVMQLTADQITVQIAQIQKELQNAR